MQNAFKFSQAANIAVHALAYMVVDSGGYLSASALGEKLGVSDTHLSKVLNRLTAQGVLKSSRGSKGGFTLAVDPDSISLLEIVEIIDGKFEYTECFLGKPVCGVQKCLFVTLQQQITDMVRNALKDVTLKEFTIQIRLGKISEDNE